MANRLSTIGLLVGLVAAFPSTLSRRDADCTPESGNINDPDCPLFYWGSIGDSYSSGVAYDGDQWDGDENGCHRVNYAYSAQLINDHTWTVGQQSGVFNGCSGSVLYDMHGNGEGGRQLINELTPLSRAIFMQAGGNNCANPDNIACNFAAIATKCLFQPEYRSYGQDYSYDPFCEGECCQAITASQAYIDNLGQGGLSVDLRNTLDDVFKTDQLAGDSLQFLYVIGYAHFFNVDTSGPGTCDDWTFGAYIHNEPKVDLNLRLRLNSLMSDFNQRYQDVINGYTPPDNKHLGFISITEGYDGHRFCEPGTTRDDQYSSANVYFWNLSFFNGETEVPWDEQSDSTDSGTASAVAAAILSDGDVRIDSDDGFWGSALRTMHPKPAGHTSIKNTILARLRADDVPGITSEHTVDCNLGMYASPTNGPIKDAVSYLNTQKTIPFTYGSQGGRISCSYGTGVFLSVDGNPSQGSGEYPGSQISLNVEYSYKHCLGSGKSGNSDTLGAFQYWGPGYNLLVTGGQNC